MRPATLAEIGRLAGRARSLIAPGAWAADQLTRVAAGAANATDVPAGPERSYRRERTGYPVLMRNLDLPPPIDLFDVREPENALASPDRGLLPPKGWLPSPVLLALLNGPPAGP